VLLFSSVTFLLGASALLVPGFSPTMS